MCSMKRVQLAVLFLIVVALFAGTAAPAARAANTRTGSAELTPVGDEPGASGSATLNAWKLSYAWHCLLGVSCDGLTPGAVYRVGTLAGGNFTATASQDGHLSTLSGWQLKVYMWIGVVWPNRVTVTRVDPSLGNVTVLSGPIVWR